MSYLFKNRYKGFIVIILLLCGVFARSQSVGLVLSGGGASAIAHIGVLKALEQDSIPIDYITGTSMGALIGAMYAAGYSPQQIEDFFLSEQFQRWAKGQINPKYNFYLRKKSDDASWVTIKIATDSLWKTNIPTNLISPIPIDFGLMKYLAPAAAGAKYNFDSLFVPFRCVAADIISRKEVVFKKGDLAQAVRASMTYPFYIYPLEIDSALLFDGGLYNNFPSDIMCKDFLPDFTIGSNVSYNYPAPQPDNVISQIKTLLVSNTNYHISCNKGIVISPNVSDISVFDFDDNKAVIDSGYAATMRIMDSIKKVVKRRISPKSLNAKRALFEKRCVPLSYDNLQITGLRKSAGQYIRRALKFKKKDTVSVKKLMPQYFKLSSDDRINKIYPQTIYNPKTGLYKLKLNIKKEKKLFVSFGGDISSRPINEGFVGLQYNYLGKTAVTFSANGYFGRFYNSGKGQIKLDFNSPIPFYLKFKGVINKWDYFKSSTAFFQDLKPSFLVVNDAYLESELAFAAGYKAKFGLEANFGYLKDRYYQTKNFTSADTTDVTAFHYHTACFYYDRNSLNRKEYANKGSRLLFKTRLVSGQEVTTPGSTSSDKQIFYYAYDWLQFHLSYEKYFNRHRKYRLGFFMDANYANQPFFYNYTATILSSPAFQPIPETKTLFQEQFRAHIFAGGGLRNIFAFNNHLQLRLSGYIFQPYREIEADKQNKAFFGPVLSRRYYIASGALVYYTPVGPVSLGVNYYDSFSKPWSFLFHFGYIIFNKKGIN